MHDLPSMADITVAGPITEEMARRLCEQIRTAWRYYHFDEVALYISSPGGEVIGMEKILREIDQCRRKGIAVRTIADGLVASAAAMIASAGSPGLREATPDARLLYHEPRYSGCADSHHTADHLNSLASSLQHATHRMLDGLVCQTRSSDGGSGPMLATRDLPARIAHLFGGEGDPDEVLPLRDIYTRILQLEVWLAPEEALALHLIDRCRPEPSYRCRARVHDQRPKTPRTAPAITQITRSCS